MKKKGLLNYIDECYNSEETKEYPEIQHIFSKYYSRKEKNLSKALIDLKTDLNLYNLDHSYKGGPNYISKILLGISQTTNISSGVGTFAFLTNIWFGR